MITADVQTLRTRFRDAFVTTLPVIHDNETSNAAQPGQTYLRFMVRPGQSSHYLGDRAGGYKRNIGRVLLEVNFPIDRGDAELYRQITNMTTTFENYVSPDGTLECDQVSVGPHLPSQNKQNVSVLITVTYSSLHHY